MLQPARVKYRKMHRGSRAGLATRGNTVAFGEYGLQSLERCWLDTKQIEAARVAINRNMKRRGKVWIRVFPQKSFTKKPLETRMGKGKGPLESWVAVIKPATVLFEVDGVPEVLARESLRLAATKLPVTTGAFGQGPRPAAGDFQPAPPAGQQPARETGPPAPAATRYCAHRNAPQPAQEKFADRLNRMLMSDTPIAAPAAPSAAARGHKKERVGEVVSAKMAKTIVVRVQRRFPHPRFKKVVTEFNKFYAHDEKGEAKPGDRVRIQECRPLSKTKRWRLVEVVVRNTEPVKVTA